MATEEINVPKGDWLEVATGPAEVILTGDDNFDFASGAAAPTLSVAHFQFAGRLLGPLRLATGEKLWVRNLTRNLMVAIDVEDLS